MELISGGDVSVEDTRNADRIGFSVRDLDVHGRRVNRIVVVVLLALILHVVVLGAVTAFSFPPTVFALIAIGVTTPLIVLSIVSHWRLRKLMPLSGHFSQLPGMNLLVWQVSGLRATYHVHTYELSDEVDEDRVVAIRRDMHSIRLELLDIEEQQAQILRPELLKFRELIPASDLLMRRTGLVPTARNRRIMEAILSKQEPEGFGKERDSS